MQPEIHQPERSHFDRIGGADKIRELVKRFYQFMDELPESYGIRRMHAENLQGSEDKLFKFLNGWMGGPDLFVQEYGHPMLRRRHLPFQIDISARDQWLMCMNLALNDVVEDEQLRAELYEAFAKVGDHMRNQN
ncbi:MAG: group II truncated hemoglobin [Proteobacteria bacterium]|nr:group II truncated hemoglobin [Pseudomonadota bacterium]